MIEEGALTAGHARTLVASEQPSDLAAKIVRLGLSVREAEQLARGGQKPRGKTAKAAPEKSPDIKALEERIMDTIGVRTEIVETGKQGGTVTIRYHTLEQLDHIIRRLESTM